MSLWIAGLGTAVPAHAIGQEGATDLAESLCASEFGGAVATAPRLLNRLYRRSGVRTRHSVLLESAADAGADRNACSDPVQQTFYSAPLDELDHGPTTRERMRLYEQTAGPLACQAATAALAEARQRPASVTHLITVSCSGFSAPGFDMELVRELELSPSIARAHIGFMGCHGALNALRVAEAFTTADPAATVLVCCVELCSLHFHYGPQADKVLANALFADGASALVVRGGNAPAGAWSLAGCGSTIVPDTTELMNWSIGDHGFEMTLSPRVPDVIRQSLRPWLSGWLAGRGLSVADVNAWAIHPGGLKILSACAESLDLPADSLWASRQVLSQYGNMSSATVLFVLDLLRRQTPSGRCVALGFGPGLAIEAALWVPPRESTSDRAG